MSVETEWIMEEQEALWHDFMEAIDRAANGVWSMGAANVAARVIQAARIVGPADIDNLSWRLTAGGIYAGLLDMAGVVYPTTSEATWARLDSLMQQFGGTRAGLTVRYAETCAAMAEDADFILSSVGEQT